MSHFPSTEEQFKDQEYVWKEHTAIRNQANFQEIGMAGQCVRMISLLELAPNDARL